MKNKKTANDWLLDLMGEIGPHGVPDQVPEGWITLAQMQEVTGLPTSTMNGRVQRMLKKGKIQKKKYKIRAGHQIVSVWHYNKA
jgi:hypothetical protein